MSCDWERHQALPEESPHVKNGRNMIVSIVVSDAIRNPLNPKRVGQTVPEWRQEIIHDPLVAIPDDKFTPNDSHSLVKGKKKAAVTTAIRASSNFRVVPI